MSVIKKKKAGGLFGIGTRVTSNRAPLKKGRGAAVLGGTITSEEELTEDDFTDMKTEDMALKRDREEGIASKAKELEGMKQQFELDKKKAADEITQMR